MKKTVILLVFLVIFCLVEAQEAKIKIAHIGFGKTTEEAYFTVHNTGDIPITDVTAYVDGNISKTINQKSGPGMGFELLLYLKPGTHLIEVRTPEGAYDSLEINVPGTKKERPTPVIEQVKSFLDEIKMIAVIGLVAIVIIILWLLLRRPKLRI